MSIASPTARGCGWSAMPVQELSAVSIAKASPGNSGLLPLSVEDRKGPTPSSSSGGLADKSRREMCLLVCNIPPILRSPAQAAQDPPAPKNGPRGGRVRKGLQREGKRTTSRFFQLPSSHAAIGSCLAERTHTIQSSECWWCGSGERQPCHLFVRCRAWATQIKEFWRRIGKACEW